jgi:hypothetical protein
VSSFYILTPINNAYIRNTKVMSSMLLIRKSHSQAERTKRSQRGVVGGRVCAFGRNYAANPTSLDWEVAGS